MANIKWIKLNVDMFDNRKIKHIRKLPAGNEVVLIWVMLLTLAGRCNAGGMIFLTENIPYNAKMLADELDFEEATVKLALDALETLGMICTNDAGFMQIPGWEAHQNVESMDRIRESKRLAQARWRAKKAAIEAHENVESTVDASTVESTRISVDDAEEEEEEEEERRNNIYTLVVQHLNEKAGTKYRASGAKTQKVIHARVAEGFTLDDFIAVIDKKTAEWMGTEWEKFLRPETLFGPKFESYLNQNTTKKGEPQNDGMEGAGAAAAYQVGTWV